MENELSAFSRGALFDNSSMTTPNIRLQNGKRTISVQPRCPFDHSVMITPENRSQSSAGASGKKFCFDELLQK